MSVDVLNCFLSTGQRWVLASGDPYRPIVVFVTVWTYDMYIVAKWMPQSGLHRMGSRIDGMDICDTEEIGLRFSLGEERTNERNFQIGTRRDNKRVAADFGPVRISPNLILS